MKTTILRQGPTTLARVSTTLFFLMVIGMCRLLPAQNRLKDIAVQFNHITSAEGFNSEKITSITQDSKGFIWIGSYGGLLRYDGYSFKIFQHDPKNPKSLGDTAVNRLFTDSAGRMWVGTVGKGLFLYDQETEEFTSYGPVSGGPDNGIVHTIMTISEDSDRNIWVGTFGDGIYLLDPRTKNSLIFCTRTETLPVSCIMLFSISSRMLRKTYG